MWRRIAWSVSAAAGILATSSLEAQPPAPAGSLLSKVDWVRFEVLLGRLTAFSNRIGQSRLVAAEGQPPDQQESITASGDGQWASVRYELTTTQRHLTWELIAQGAVTLVDEPRSDSKRPVVRFTQPPQGEITLEVESDKGKSRYRAASLWHLLLAEPEICQQHLVPCLETLRPAWRLLETSRQIEQELFERVEATPPDSERVKQLVSELGHAQFRRRQTADRELRAMGVAVLPSLNRLRAEDLSTEQIFRVRKIQQSFQSATGDTPERVAAWLLDDRAVWVTLLAHREPPKREAAAQHLTEVAQDEIPFDPWADEVQRSRQIARLRERFAY